MAPVAHDVGGVFGLAFGRGPGCSQACSRLFGHDAVTHERYGRATALREASVTPRGVVVVGRLTVDVGASTATVDGRQVPLTPNDCALLCRLAVTPGQVCAHDALIVAGWGPATADAARISTHDRRLHFLRAAVMRLRLRLGPDGALIETVKFCGYRLNATLAGATTEG